jgi:hypothetical protein
MAAHIRAVFDATIVISCAVVALIALGHLATTALVHRLRTPRPWSGNALWQFVIQPTHETDRRALKVATIVFVTAFVLIVPWKLRNLVVLGQFSLRACDGAYVAYWSYDMPPAAISGDSGCVANPDLCAIVNAQIASLTPDLGRRLTLFAIVFSPRAYFANKLRHVPEFWVGTPWHLLGSRNRGFLLEGSISLLAGMLALWWAVRGAFRMRGSRAIFSAFFLGFCLQNVLVFTLLHYEYRYSLPIRLFFFYAPWWMASLTPGETAVETS